MKKRSLEAVKDDLARSTVKEVAASHGEVNQSEALLMLGGIGAINRLTNNLSAQTIHALEAFGEAKAYERLGFKTFAEFLDNSAYSPMTKHQYYERRSALEAEGDAAYDLLNNIGVPLSKRKLLAAGSVQVEGDKLYIGKDDGQQSVVLADRARVIEVIQSLVEENARKAKKIEKGQEQHAKLKRERDELKKSTGASITEFDQTFLQLLGTYAAFTKMVEDLSDDEKQFVRENVTTQLANQRLMLDEAFGFSAPNSNGNYALSDKELDEVGENF